VNRLLRELNKGLQPRCHTIFVVVIDVEPIRERFSAVAPFLDERGRRLVAAAEAFAVGYGGIAAVATATGMAPSTIGRGLKELAQDEPSERVRRPGAGRKPAIAKDPRLLPDLEALVEPTTRGDPQAPFSTRRVTVCKATAKPRRATAIPTGMPNSPISTPRWPRLWPNNNR
jgi:hypothetical protein